MADKSYEFTPEQDAVIRELARKMQGVGVFMIVLAALALAGFVTGLATEPARPGLAWIAVAAFLGLIGWWTVRAARELLQVADTEGADIPHLMRAFGELKKFYSLHFWLIVVYLVLIVLTILGIPQGLG